MLSTLIEKHAYNWNAAGYLNKNWGGVYSIKTFRMTRVNVNFPNVMIWTSMEIVYELDIWYFILIISLYTYILGAQKIIQAVLLTTHKICF